MLKIKNSINEKPALDYPPNPSFGTVQVPIILWCEIRKDETQPRIVHLSKLEDFPTNPFTSVLHYGQSIFEGLKAYHLENNQAGIFRLKAAAQRFQRSSQIMSMANIEPEFFEECVKEYVKECREYMPKLDLHSLYLRPLMYAHDQKIKVASSDSYIFAVMGSIVGDYFGSSDQKTKVIVNKQFVRAFKGGTGEAKTAANYALSLPSVDYAIKKGYQQVLYLDAETKTSFEELGGMNFFWVKNGELYTPELNGQILRGITRMTILEIAGYLGIKAHETKLTLEDLIQGHKDKSISEVFACGTAATLVPLDEIGIVNDDESITSLNFNPGPVGDKLRSFLRDSHVNKTEFSQRYLTIV